MREARAAMIWRLVRSVFSAGQAAHGRVVAGLGVFFVAASLILLFVRPAAAAAPCHPDAIVAGEAAATSTQIAAVRAVGPAVAAEDDACCRAGRDRPGHRGQTAGHCCPSASALEAAAPPPALAQSLSPQRLRSRDARSAGMPTPPPEPPPKHA